MYRRTFLKGATAMPFGTSRAQGFNNPAVAIFRAGNTIITKLGNFIYSGKPESGDLIASIVGGTAPIQSDPYGNTVYLGIYSYVTSSQFAGLAGAGVNIQDGNFPWQIQVDPSSGLLVIQFPHTGTQLYMQNTGSTGSWVPNQPGTLSPETWHNVTPPVGFTGMLRYRMRAENDVEVEAQLAVSPTAPTGTILLITLPGMYSPAHTQHGSCGIFPNGTPASLAAVQGIMALRWSANPAGTFTLQGFPGGAAGTGITECSFNIRYSLD